MIPWTCLFFDARTVVRARGYSGFVANEIGGREDLPPPISLADGLSASALEAFFKLQQNLHHFIAIASYLDRELGLARTGGSAV